MMDYDDSNQGGGPSGSAWAITDAIIAAILVGLIAAIVFGA